MNSLVLRIKRRAPPIDITNADDPAGRQQGPELPQRVDGSTQMLQHLMGKNRIETFSREAWLIDIAHFESQVLCRAGFCK